VPHATTEDITYGDYIIPKDTILIPNIPALSRSPERYQHAEVFEPLRFLHDDQSSASSARSADYLGRDHFQFGFGQRFCPGSHIAEDSLYIAIVRIVWGFNIEAVHGAPELNMEQRRRKSHGIFPEGGMLIGD
jgi:cytochrome P450